VRIYSQKCQLELIPRSVQEKSARSSYHDLPRIVSAVQAGPTCIFNLRRWAALGRSVDLKYLISALDLYTIAAVKDNAWRLPIDSINQWKDQQPRIGGIGTPSSARGGKRCTLDASSIRGSVAILLFSQ
jgi:hypothetical protein